MWKLRKITLGFGLIAILVLVFIAGAHFGYVRGAKQLNLLFGDSVVGNLKNEIINLKYLRTGEVNASIDRLEGLADMDISYLGTRLKDANYTPQQKKHIVEILKEAKKYREQYPQHKPKFKAAVENVFKEISGQ